MGVDSGGAEAFREHGFPVGAEPLVSVDLVDTTLSPQVSGVRQTDRFEEAGAFETWWLLEAKRLPAGDRPDLTLVLRLRTALRALYEARIDGQPLSPWALEDVNCFAASAPTSWRLTHDGRREQRWHHEHGGNAALAMMANEAISLLADPQTSALLRRCANPECSMIFVAGNRRRVWCSSGICGNRARVARHYKRIKSPSG